MENGEYYFREEDDVQCICTHVPEEGMGGEGRGGEGREEGRVLLL